MKHANLAWFTRFTMRYLKRKVWSSSLQTVGPGKSQSLANVAASVFHWAIHNNVDWLKLRLVILDGCTLPIYWYIYWGRWTKMNYTLFFCEWKTIKLSSQTRWRAVLPSTLGGVYDACRRYGTYTLWLKEILHQSISVYLSGPIRSHSFLP